MAGVMLAAGCVGTRSDVSSLIIMTDSSGQVVDNAVKSSKTGIAEAKGIIVVAFGDSSIDAACKAGGITKIHHVDYETFNVLGIYGTVKTVVYGE